MISLNYLLLSFVILLNYPPTGTLMPGQRLNAQVKFMPTEEV